MNADIDRDNDLLMEEVFYKDGNVKSKLLGLEKTGDHMYMLIENSYRRLSEFDAEFRFLRRFVYTSCVAIIGGLVTIIIQLWRS